MADLGTLDTKTRPGVRYSTILDVWAATNAAHASTKVGIMKNSIWTSHLDPSASGSAGVDLLADNRVLGVISGTVTVHGLPLANARIFVYERRTGMLVGTTLTATNGTYSVNRLSRLSADYMVVVLHPNKTEQAAIFDQVDAL